MAGGKRDEVGETFHRDEIAVADCDLDRCREIQDNIFNFAVHRQPDQYRLIVERKGAVDPA